MSEIKESEFIYLTNRIRYRALIYEECIRYEFQIFTRRSIVGWHFKRKWRMMLETREFNDELSKYVKNTWS